MEEDVGGGAMEVGHGCSLCGREFGMEIGEGEDVSEGGMEEGEDVGG